MRHLKRTGFILKRRNYGEADKIVTIFTLEEGKQTYSAKGIRRIRSRRAASLEAFSHLRFNVYKNKGLGIITETELINSYHSLSDNYNKTYIAYQIVELIDKLTQEEQPHPELFMLLDKALTFLKETDFDKEKSEKVLIRFKSRILEYLGFGLPKVKTLESLTHFIEEILEKELVSRKSFELY